MDIKFYNPHTRKPSFVPETTCVKTIFFADSISGKTPRYFVFAQDEKGRRLNKLLKKRDWDMLNCRIVVWERLK